MAKKPEKVLNSKTGEWENCIVGDGCRLHFHEPIKEQDIPDLKIEPTSDSDTLSEYLEKAQTKLRVSEETLRKNKQDSALKIGVAFMGMGPGVVIGGGTAWIATAAGMAATPAIALGLGIVGVLSLGSYFAINAYLKARHERRKKKVSELESKLKAHKKKEAADEHVTVDEYENPIA